MKIRVQRESGTIENIELSHGDWHVAHRADRNCLVGAGITHSFTTDGYYEDSRPTPVIHEEDASREGVRRGDPAYLARPGTG
jgi:hypothetical protein